LTLGGILALLLAGINLYNAVVHTFTTVTTGGFSPKSASVAFYDSLAVETVLIVIMVLSGVSFSLYSQRRFAMVLTERFCGTWPS